MGCRFAFLARYPRPVSDSGCLIVSLLSRRFFIGSRSELTNMVGVPVAPGDISFAPATITFPALPAAENSKCK
jgi:hypothetical protein